MLTFSTEIIFYLYTLFEHLLIYNKKIAITLLGGFQVMKCVVKATERYLGEAKKYNCADIYVRLKKKIERECDYQGNNLDAYGGFENGTYFKKRHVNYRSIFIRRKLSIRNEEVYCYLALCVFKRGDSQYDTFMHAKTTAVRETAVGLGKVDWESIRKEIENELTPDVKEKVLPELSREEGDFIENGNGITQEIFDTPVYESEQWIASVRNGDFDDFMKVSAAIIEKTYELVGDEQVGCYEIPYGDEDEKILCVRLLSSGDGGSARSKDGLFLLGLGGDEEIRKAREAFSLNGEELPSYEDLAAKCRRAYPFKMMEDDGDFWRAMEKDKDSNFILSDEEINIVAKPITFPLFLTGRAGSGKSTMLQYLFADYFLRYCKCGNILPPVYLSYNSNLIENAKRLSKSLFSKNHAYAAQLKELNKNFKNDIEPEFGNVFFVFHQLVRDCIRRKNPEVLSTRFSPEKHVSYSKFRDLWNRKFGRDPQADKYNSDLSWHVIRTYVKGWNSDDYYCPEDYEEIGRDNKSVTDEVFKLVYDKVWEGWYKKEQEENGFWDDQDLIRYCLSPDDESCETCVEERFSAIFCDESQDFTRVETEFILRLSLFSNRRIYNENMLNRLPFVFAGDEFQTLNPTGFSWDSLRSYFTERLIRATDLPKSVGAPEPVVLKKNYRSTAPIVKLSNRLQLLREARCGRRGGIQSVPQIPYNPETNAMSVYCLSSKDAMVWKKLREMHVVLIVPYSDGQTPKDFIENSHIKGMIDFYDDGSPKNITVCNPLQAKGLEYPCVAVYGFDSIVPEPLKLNELEKWLESPVRQNDDESDEIDLKYFLSNAYVSVTRAKTKLFILSDPDGSGSWSDSFWSFAFSQDNDSFQKRVCKIEDMMLSKLKHPENWRKPNNEPLLGYIVRGDIGSITNENIVDSRELAKILEDRGKVLFDSVLMRQAAGRYRESGMTDDEYRCVAYAYEFEHEFFKAAELFIKAKRYDEAVSDLWRAYSPKDMNGFLRSIANLASDSMRLEAKIARCCISSHPNLNDFVRFVDDLLTIICREDDDPMKNLVLETKLTWNDVLLHMLGLISKASPAQQNALKVLVQKCAQLEAYGINLFSKIPMIAFETELYDVAIDLWEKKAMKDRERPKEYHQAKCKVLKYPEDIPHWQLSGISAWRENVVKEYHEDEGRHPITDLVAHRILETALFSAGSAEEQEKAFLQLLEIATGINEARELLRQALGKGMSLARECYEGLFLLRWGSLDGWSGKGLIYQSDSLNKLVKIIDKIKYVRSSGFMQLLKESFGDLKRYVSDVMNDEFGEFNRVDWNPILLVEIGVVMEKRGFFVDAARFYEWAQRQTDDIEFKRELVIRWIACKERQVETTPNKDDMLNEIAQKRQEIDLPFDAEIPLLPKFDNWVRIYGKLQKINPEKRKIRNQSAVRPKPNRTSESLTDRSLDRLAEISKSSFGLSAIGNHPLPHVSENDFRLPKALDGNGDNDIKFKVQDAFASKIVTYDMGGYQFRYNAMLSELSISLSNDQEDLRVKIKKGVFPADGDFVLNGNRLVKSDSGEETPFLVDISEDLVRIVDTRNSDCKIFPLNKQ